MKRLIGKKIIAVFVGDKIDTGIYLYDIPICLGEFIKFVTDGGDVMFHADGNCCSESWFSDITGFDALIGGTVSSIEDREFDEEEAKKIIEDGKTRQDVDKVYGYVITTDKGRADIWFRNSSNGYYGGSGEDYPAQSGSPWRGTDEWAEISWRQITDDWTA